MIYLVVGVDRRSLASWHENVAAPDAGGAGQTARDHARGRGVELVVAAVIGPGTTVLAEAAEELALAVPAAA